MDFPAKEPVPAVPLEHTLEEAMALAIRCEKRLEQIGSGGTSLKLRTESARLYAEYCGAMHAIARIQTCIANRTAESLLHGG